MTYNPWDTFKTNLSKQVSAVGTAFRLPEMNISERIAPKVQASAPQQLPQITTTAGQPTQNFGSVAANYQAPSSGGTGGQVLGGQTGDGGGNPPMENNPGQPSIDYDAMIRPALDALDQAIAPQESSYAATLQGIEANKSKGLGELDQSISQAGTEAGRSRERVTGQTESAVDESRRQFAEIQKGLQARYGGTTGSGAFTEGLAGRQALQNIGQQRTALTQAITTIDDRLEQVRSVTELAKQDLTQQVEAQKAQAKAQLDNALNSIRIARGELMSKKVEMAQSAMQFYQQQVAQVNARNAAFEQQLYRDQQAAEQALLTAKGKASSAVQKLQLVNIDSIPYTFNPSTGETQRANVTQQGAGYLGGVQGTEDDFIDG